MEYLIHNANQKLARTNLFNITKALRLPLKCKGINQKRTAGKATTSKIPVSPKPAVLSNSHHNCEVGVAQNSPKDSPLFTKTTPTHVLLRLKR